MISQEDNKLIDIKFIDNRDMTCANIYFFKNLAHAYFRRRIFSKSFGGKIRHIWTDVTYRKDNEICARIFLSFFGGKLKTFKQSITRVKLTKNSKNLRNITCFRLVSSPRVCQMDLKSDLSYSWKKNTWSE